MESFIES